MQPKKRRDIWRRDGRRCMKCRKRLSRRGFTIDHIVPKSKGGTFEVANLQTMCGPCNHAKNDSLP